MRAQEKRHQMMNDIKALCNVTEPSLVQFIGAYHAPENGQVMPDSFEIISWIPVHQQQNTAPFSLGTSPL